jgi:hypothetical protein
MANEITYEVMGTDSMGNLVVKYSMGEHSLELGLPWHGEGDIDEFIKNYTPRQNLKHMAAAATVDHDALKGKTGTVDLEPAPPAKTVTGAAGATSG